LNAVAAAQKIGGDIDLLVAGHEAGEAAKAAAAVPGVRKVLHADAPHLGEFLAENVSALVAGLGKDYSHILAPATSNGKNVMPRVAALRDVQQVSDIVAGESADAVVRPLYGDEARGRGGELRLADGADRGDGRQGRGRDHLPAGHRRCGEDRPRPWRPS